MERGHIQGLPQFFEYPLLAQEPIKLKFGRHIHRVHPNKIPLKFLGKNGAWAYPGTAPNFLVPPILPGTGKATNFKLGRYIHRVFVNKSPLKIWEKMERGRIQGLSKFLKYPLLSQECVKLRTSNLADVFRESIRTKAN